MKTWVEIQEVLNQPLPKDLINPPDSKRGIYGEWIKGSAAMELANKVFGPDGWTSELLSEPQCKNVDIGVNKKSGELRQALVSIIHIRVTGRGLDGDGNVVEVYHEDIGFGTAQESIDRRGGGGYLPMKPAQHRAALMGCVTIGIKRCLHQFGRHLGMDLYINDEDEMAALWGDDEAPSASQQQDQQPQQQDQQPSQEAAEGPQQPAEATEVASEGKPSQSANKVKLGQAGKVSVPTKKVRDELGGKATVALVYAKMLDYAMWMCEEAAESDSQAFRAMRTYDAVMTKVLDYEYTAQGGTYIPWKGTGKHNPTVMVGHAVERAAVASAVLRGAIMERFPSESGADANVYHLSNHLKKHFGGDRIAVLTWEQLAAFRDHIVNSAEYPEQWSGETAKAEETESSEPQDFMALSIELLEEIDSKITSGDGKKSMVDLGKKYPLGQETAYRVLVGINNAVQQGSLEDYEATKVILATAMGGLVAAE